MILAGGVGARTGLAVPKQLVPIAGQTSLEHTLGIFESSPCIDSIVLMMEPQHLQHVEALIAGGRFGKLRTVRPGGSTRNETSKLALALIPAESKVLFHDAVRPLVDHRIIQDCVTALDTFDAVDTAIASADTIIEVNEQNCIAAVPRRSTLRRGQTPQAFRQHVLAAAYKMADRDPNFEATDDCSVVLKYSPDTPIFVVDGSDANIKITEAVDFHIADKLFQLRGSVAPVGTHAARDLAGQSVVIFGTSYGIGHDLAVILEKSGAVVYRFSRSETGTDIAVREDVSAALRSAADRSGRIDHVVVTAGVLHQGPLKDMSELELTESLGTNLLGPLLVAQLGHPYLKNSGGSMLLYTSSSYTRGRAGYGAYSASKAAIVNLTQALAEEWHEDGIRVNCINPARTATPMRTAAFGNEDPATLLASDFVAQASASVLASGESGHVFDLRLAANDPLPLFEEVPA